MRCPDLSELPAPPDGKTGWPWTEQTPRLPETMPDGSPWPTISMVTPSYNQARFIEQTLRSVLLQGYPSLEYYVMDGGSTDGSAEVIRRYERWLTYWVSEPDRGQSHAINKGFQGTHGDVLNWLNSDDYLLQNALDRVASARHVQPQAGAWCGACLIVDMLSRDRQANAVHQPKRLDNDGIADWGRNYFLQPACFFSRSAWEKCGPLDEGLHYVMDFDLWLKIAKFAGISGIDQVLAAATMHMEAKTSSQNAGRVYAEQCLVQFRHGCERFAMDDIVERWDRYIEAVTALKQARRLPFFLRPIAARVRNVKRTWSRK